MQALDKWNPENWDIDPDALRKKIKEFHKYLTKCEEIKYDAEQRLIAQDYDVRSHAFYQLTTRFHTKFITPAVERIERAPAPGAT